MILASMGLWEHLSPSEVIEVINENDYKDYGSCSEQIIHKVKEASLGEGMQIDDITFIISHLN